MKFVTVKESLYNNGKWLIFYELDKMPFTEPRHTFHILGARVLGLTYAEFLRMCRDWYGATIVGKNSLYPIPYFNSEQKAKELAEILNNRLSTVLS